MKTHTYTSKDLLNISKEQFYEWIGLKVHILKKDKTEFIDVVSKIQLAANPPHLACGFILTNNRSISFLSIEIVDLYK